MDQPENKNKCFICGAEVIWENDWDAIDEYGYEEPGIVHTYHCPKCGADLTVYERFSKEE